MAKAQAQTTTGRTRIKNGLSVTLYGAASKGKEGTYGSAGPVGTGLEPGLIVAIPSGQTANSLQIEQPEGTAIAGFDSSGALFLCTGSKLHTDLVTISSANITDTGAGHLGHAAGVPLVAAPGAGSWIEFCSAFLSYTFATAAYTGGGNITVNATGGSAITGLISHAASLGAGASTGTVFYPLSTAGVTVATNTGVSLVSVSAPTQPGTAAGTVKVYVTYRIHLL